MLSMRDRWLILGAWALLAASTVAGFCLINARVPATPEPTPAVPPPPPPEPTGNRAMDRFWKCQEVLTSVHRPQTPYVGCMVPTIIEVVKPKPPPGPTRVLPVALYSGKFEMDRANLSWNLRNPVIDPKDKKFVLSAPQAFLIHRQCDGGEIERIAILDAKATSFEDRDVQPNHSYRYWVLVRGEEGAIVYPATRAPVVDREGEGSVEGTVPAWHKVKLLGGGRDHAILSVESYNPKTGQWETKRVLASPGQAIGASGWTLERMRFDKSTLVAEVKDDLRDAREISTKKE